MGLWRVSYKNTPIFFLKSNPMFLNSQEAFMENYFASQRDRIFKNVEVLIYVFDVESRDWEKDLHYYQSCLEAILANSKEARIFCLIHKMDLVPENQRDHIFEQRVTELRKRSEPLNIQAFRTSIWDETLYAVSSKTVYATKNNIESFLFLGLVSNCSLLDS
jgi:Ras-related GTP-binding protein A/B